MWTLWGSINRQTKKVSVSKTNQSRATKKAALEELQIKITKAINKQNTDAELIARIEEFIESKIGLRRQSTIDSYRSELEKIKEFFPVGTHLMLSILQAASPLNMAGPAANLKTNTRIEQSYLMIEQNKYSSHF